MTDLSEELTGRMSEAAWVEAGRQGLVRRPISASDERTQSAKVDAVVCAAVAAREYSKQPEEVPTHFEWPEHYEVGDVQATACEIPLEGCDHTSYRKEVTCVACLQTMLAAALAENGGSEPEVVEMRPSLDEMNDKLGIGGREREQAD